MPSKVKTVSQKCIRHVEKGRNVWTNLSELLAHKMIELIPYNLKKFYLKKKTRDILEKSVESLNSPSLSVLSCPVMFWLMQLKACKWQSECRWYYNFLTEGWVKSFLVFTQRSPPDWWLKISSSVFVSSMIVNLTQQFQASGLIYDQMYSYREKCFHDNTLAIKSN
jgi:hypothetical protein